MQQPLRRSKWFLGQLRGGSCYAAIILRFDELKHLPATLFDPVRAMGEGGTVLARLSSFHQFVLTN